jgi:predicted phosphodiesterase
MSINWDSVPGEVITVISDLHSNKRAIKAAIDQAHSKRTDQLIILGDILTYGIDTIETIELVQKELDAGAKLLMGNHDSMYLQLISGDTNTFNKLRPDLQESIMYNLDRLDKAQFTKWSWNQAIVHNNIFFSHANPFGDLWSYINDDDDFMVAAMAIKKKDHLAGIFGHTHRSRCYSLKGQDITNIEGLTDDTFIINPGSVGQPRIRPPQATLLRLSSHENRLWAEIEPVQYDMQGHVDDLRVSSLSKFTKTILNGFFRE